MKIKLIDYGIKESGIDIPKAQFYNDAGCDVRLIESLTIPPYSVCKTKLGFGIELPNGYMSLLMPRSGLNSKGLTILYSPIDSGYTGEISAILYNTTKESIQISKGERIGQLVVVPCINVEYTWDLGNERGNGGFGSTGTI